MKADSSALATTLTFQDMWDQINSIVAPQFQLSTLMVGVAQPLGRNVLPVFGLLHPPIKIILFLRENG